MLKDILAGRRLEELVDRARAAEALDAQVRALLPPDLAAHVTGASLREDVVVVLVDSAVWASRLRFYAPELAARLEPRTDGRVGRVRVRVAPPPVGPPG